MRIKRIFLSVTFIIVFNGTQMMRILVICYLSLCCIELANDADFSLLIKKN
jgi:hypothetical protein